MHRFLWLACVTLACTSDPAPSSNPAAQADAVALTWEQTALGCALMGEGASAHAMCNHGHSISLHNENLWVRRLFLLDHGLPEPTEADLMATDHGLPEPLTPILRARLGERVRVRVVSYGPQFHTFHIHGHLWLDGGQPIDTKTLGPAEVMAADFFAGASATDATERAGVGDWMYHCHVETHAETGMWGLFRVLAKDGVEGLGPDGRFAHEVPLPLGGTGQTVDVWVVAVEAPLAVARDYDKSAKGLTTVERLARLYVPVADEAAFTAATAGSVKKVLLGQKETWTPWILSLRLGTQVRVHLRNLMPETPVSLHPHGVAYGKDEDGTMPEDVALPGGQPVVMTWKADTPGTWPVHDHAKSLENLGRGLFAAIVVKTPQEETLVQRDYLLFFHDYDMDWLMGAEVPQGAGH
jgi:FtsP/CotA-like multicopper oxidase with cupredoxin domain